MKKSKKKIGIIILILAFSILSINSISASDSINLTDSDTIQDAIDSTDNGVINLENKTYTGEKNTNLNINASKNITIQSKDPNNKTTIDYEFISSKQITNNGNLTLINLIIKNSGWNFNGLIRNNANLTLINCTFTNNLEDNNYGIIYNSGNVTIYNSIFLNNKRIIYNTGYSYIVNSNFTNNTGSEGGTIYSNNGKININDCIFINNTANKGGAIYGGGIVKNSIFENNNATNGGAIYITSNDVINITNSTFKYNNATNGGAITSYFQYMGGGTIPGSLNINNSNFYNNTATLGGSIYNYGNNLNITQSQFQNNNATNGGAIYIQKNTNLENYNLNISININKSNFTNNKATSSGGAIYNNDTSNIINSIFNSNIANNGGAISNNGGKAAISNINNSSFTNNTATGQGGAIDHGMSAILNINNSNFTDNNSTNYGNTISSHYANSTSIISSIFKSSTNGEIIYNSVGILNITHSLFTECYTNNNPFIISSNAINNFDYNWWGSNNDPNSKISGATLNNYYHVGFNFIINNMENAVISAFFVLNGTNDTFGSENLPTMNFKLYNNKNFIGNYSTNEESNFKLVSGPINLEFILDNESYNYNLYLNNTNNNETTKINSEISILSTKGSYGQTITLTTKLIANKKALTNKKVNFYINGKLIGTSTTNKDGIAKLNYKISDVSQYTVKTSFNGDSQYNKIESNIYFTSTKAKTTMTLNKKLYKGKIYTKIRALGKPLKNKVIKVYVKGKYVGKVKTNSKGIALFKYSKKYGKVKVQTLFSGDKLYSRVYKTSKIKL